jgi:hypothetical protein
MRSFFEHGKRAIVDNLDVRFNKTIIWIERRAT